MKNFNTLSQGSLKQEDDENLIETNEIENSYSDGNNNQIKRKATDES